MTNELFLNGEDAWAEYGANLSEGSILELMLPLPKKDLVESNVRNTNGRILRGVEWDDIREQSLSMHITQKGTEESFSSFQKLCNEVFSKGRFTLRSKYIEETFYFIYRDCTPISSNNGIIKFSVKVVREVVEPQNS